MTTTEPAIDRRTALLDAAVAEIARHGARGLRVEHVAKAANVSVALIYHYFGDRSTLLQRALEHVGTRAVRYTSRPLGETRRATLVATLLDEIQEAPEVRTNSAAWGELRDTAIFDEALRPTLAGLTAEWVENIATLVRAGQRDGSIPASVPAGETAVRLTALVEGISGRWLTELLSTERARDHLATGIEALLAESSRSSE
jgi:AcrR family transcriptional regulator